VPDVEIIITGRNRSSPAWDKVQQEARRSVQAIVAAFRAGTDNISAMMSKAANDMSGSLTGAGAAAGRNLETEVEKGLNDLTDDFADAGREAGEVLADRIRAAGSDTAGAARKAGQDAGRAFTDGAGSGIGSGGGIEKRASGSFEGIRGAAGRVGVRCGELLKSGIVAGVAAAGALAGSALTQYVDASSARAKLAAQLGGSPEWAARAGGIVGEVYGRGVVDSFQSAADAFRTSFREGLIPVGATNDQIEKITAKVSNLGMAFGEDVTPLAAAAGKMIKSGLATGSQALDILTVGLQTNANEAQDLLETYIEYSTQFRKLGISGAQSLGLISQAMRAGARDSDTAADALKEFSVRSIDGSDATRKAFADLGLSYQTMSRDIAGGGTKANKALDLTLDRLRGVKNPVDQAALAVALFGTKAEDLGQALFAMDPSTAVSSLRKIEGAADQVGKTLESSPGAALERFKRNVQEKLAEIGGQMVMFATEHSNVMGPLIAALGGVTLAVMGLIAVVGTLNILMAANPVVLLVGAIVVSIAAMVAAITYLWKTNDGFRNAIISAWSAITSWVTSSISTMGQKITELWTWFTQLPGRIWSGLQSLPGLIGSVFQSAADMMAYWTGYAIGWTVKQFILAPGQIWNSILAIPGILGSVFSSAGSAMSSAASKSINWTIGQFKSAPGRIWSALQSVGSVVKSAFSGAGRWLYNAGRAIIQGAIDGIHSLAASAYNSASSIGSSMVSGFRDSIGWHSPAAEFVPGGEAIVQGIQQGIQRSTSDAVGSVGSLGRSMMDVVAPTVSGVTPSAGGVATAPAVARVVVEFKGGDGSALEDMIMQVIRKRVRIEGGGDVQVAFGRGGM